MIVYFQFNPFFFLFFFFFFLNFFLFFFFLYKFVFCSFSKCLLVTCFRYGVLNKSHTTSRTSFPSCDSSLHSRKNNNKIPPLYIGHRDASNAWTFSRTFRPLIMKRISFTDHLLTHECARVVPVTNIRLMRNIHRLPRKESFRKMPKQRETWIRMTYGLG